MATIMVMPPATVSWPRVQELVTSMGLTVLLRMKKRESWTITFEEDLNQGQKAQLEARIAQVISGVEWS